jgi:hypothetical protein
MHGEARLLTLPHNYAVVQLPDRQFPGVVVQGDSLDNLIGELEVAWHDPDPDEREAAFELLMETLLGAQQGYEAALREAGIGLPYPPRN